MADGDQGTHALPPLVIDQPKSRQQQGTGDTGAKGNASCKLGVDSCAKPESLDCPQTDYQKELRQKAKAAKDAELEKLGDHIKCEFSNDYPNGVDPDILRADDKYQSLQQNLSDTENLPDSFFLSGDNRAHLAYMDGLDQNIAKLKGPDFGYGKGYETLIAERCSQKQEVAEDTKLDWIQRNLQSDTPAGRALSEAVTGLTYGALGARMGGGESIRPTTAPEMEATPLERQTKPSPDDQATPPLEHQVKPPEGDTKPAPDSDAPPPQDTEAPKPKEGTATKGEPVDVTNGEYLETWEDFLIPGTIAFDGSRYMGLKLGLPGRYRSPLGSCQISAFDEIIYSRRKGELTYVTSQGEEIGFERPFNFLDATNPAYPALSLTAPWLRRLDLEDGRLVKRFRQFRDKVYRLEAVETLDGRKCVFARRETGVHAHRELRAGGAGSGDKPQDVQRFWYDGRGLLEKAENGSSLVEYRRDKNGAVIAEALNGRWVESRRDAMGWRVARRIGKSLVAPMIHSGSSRRSRLAITHRFLSRTMRWAAKRAGRTASASSWTPLTTSPASSSDRPVVSTLLPSGLASPGRWRRMRRAPRPARRSSAAIIGTRRPRRWPSPTSCGARPPMPMIRTGK